MRHFPWLTVNMYLLKVEIISIMVYGAMISIDRERFCIEHIIWAKTQARTFQENSGKNDEKML